MTRVDLITGGTTGIGSSAALMFKDLRYQFVCNYVGDKDRVDCFIKDTVIQKILNNCGSVNVLVNNAGIIDFTKSLAQETALAILFLVHDECDFITGETLSVNGESYKQ